MQFLQNDMIAIGLIAVAAAMFRFGFNEMYKKKRRKTFFASVSLLLSLSYFGWLLAVRGATTAAMAVTNWSYVAIGAVMILLALALWRGPQKIRSRGRAILYLITGLVMLALGFGLIAFAAWQSLPAIGYLILGT